jgi:hypothetical protein
MGTIAVGSLVTVAALVVGPGRLIDKLVEGSQNVRMFS